jgi:hypothetical protein
MAYQVVFRDDARKVFERLDRGVRQQVSRVIDRLADNPRPAQATQLVGDPRTWRARAGTGGSCTKSTTGSSWSWCSTSGTAARPTAGTERPMSMVPPQPSHNELDAYIDGRWNCHTSRLDKQLCMQDIGIARYDHQT